MFQETTIEQSIHEIQQLELEIKEKKVVMVHESECLPLLSDDDSENTQDRLNTFYGTTNENDENTTTTTTTTTEKEDFVKMVSNLVDIHSLSKDHFIELTGQELLGTLLINALNTTRPQSVLYHLGTLIDKNLSLFNSTVPLKIYTHQRVTEMTSQDLRARLLLESLHSQGPLTMEHIRVVLNEQKDYFDSGEIIHIFNQV